MHPGTRNDLPNVGRLLTWDRETHSGIGRRDGGDDVPGRSPGSSAKDSSRPPVLDATVTRYYNAAILITVSSVRWPKPLPYNAHRAVVGD